MKIGPTRLIQPTQKTARLISGVSLLWRIMSLPLVYIDQNIIGLQLDGRLKLTKQNDFFWVYSKEHFVEIRRSSNAHRYLSVLEELDAKLLELNLNSDWKIIGTATLVEQGTASQHYASYVKAMGDVDFDENLFDPLQAWLNGGGDEDYSLKISQVSL